MVTVPAERIPSLMLTPGKFWDTNYSRVYISIKIQISWLENDLLWTIIVSPTFYCLIFINILVSVLFFFVRQYDNNWLKLHTTR